MAWTVDIKNLYLKRNTICVRGLYDKYPCFRTNGATLEKPAYKWRSIGFASVVKTQKI